MNYNDTNFTDDPCKQRVLIRRGTKHSYKILDASKSSVSVMFATSGNGMFCLLYIVYKSKNLYPECMLEESLKIGLIEWLYHIVVGSKVEKS